MNEDVTVCVVDDDERLRAALLRLLVSGGFQARSYDSAQAFLDDAPRCDHAIAVVLSDLRMPGMDGFTLAERLALLPAPPPVVFLTAHGDVPSARCFSASIPSRRSRTAPPG
jgi:FixJ family two-component response regulator